MNNIDLVIYINLDKRPDRKEQVLQQLAKFPELDGKIMRHAAMLHDQPAVGCSLSHAGALRKAHDAGVECALILEDDFDFVEPIDMIRNKLNYFFGDIASMAQWDALLLSRKVSTYERFNENLVRLTDCSNASGYIIRRHCMLPLADLAERGAAALSRTGMHWLYAIDVIWCHLMKRGNWFTFNEPLGYQRVGFSDISGTVSDNRCLDILPL